jgi:hypothetical protein
MAGMFIQLKLSRQGIWLKRRYQQNIISDIVRAVAVLFLPRLSRCGKKTVYPPLC